MRPAPRLTRRATGQILKGRAVRVASREDRRGVSGSAGCWKRGCHCAGASLIFGTEPTSQQCSSRNSTPISSVSCLRSGDPLRLRTKHIFQSSARERPAACRRTHPSCPLFRGDLQLLFSPSRILPSRGGGSPNTATKMPLELTQSRVQKIWVPVDHRPSLPRCECRQLHGGLSCRLRRVQSPAIVCAEALCRFPSAGSTLVPASRARRGWRRAASPRLGRRGAVIPETSSVCPAGPELTEASASQRLEKPGCSGVRSGRQQQGRGHQHQRPFSLGLLRFTISFLHPSDLSAALCISIFILTPETAGSWLQEWFMGW